MHKLKLILKKCCIFQKLRKYLKWYLILSCSLLFLLFSPINLAEQQKTEINNSITRTYSFKEMGWDSSVTLNGFTPSYTFYLPLSASKEISKAVLHLRLSFSPYLNENTKLEIKFNEVLLRRVSIPADVSQPMYLDIELPLTEITANFQALTLNAYLAGTKNLCNPNLWIYPSPQSSLSLTTKSTPFTGVLNQLPSLFIKPMISEPASLVLALPPRPRAEEIYSMFNLAFYLGQLTKGDPLQLQMNYIDRLSAEQKNQNIILLSNTKQLETLTKFLGINDNESLINTAQLESSGLLLLQKSPFNESKGLLVLSGKNKEAIEKALGLFSVSELNKMVSKQAALIDELQIKPEPLLTHNWQEFSLRKDGYADKTIFGLGHHTLTYRIRLPNDRTLKDATIKTLITAPTVTLTGHSQVKLLINGKMQSSTRLTTQHTAWEYAINTEALKPGVNTISYLIDLHVDDERCNMKDFQQIWTTLYADTTVTAFFQDNFPKAALNQLPVPFSSKLMVVVPPKLSFQDIQNLVNFSYKLGQLFQDYSIKWEFRDSDKMDEKRVRRENLILYGTEESNQWIQYVFKYLVVSLKDSARILNSPDANIQVDVKGSTGLLELASSPWGEKKAILLLTGNDKVGLNMAIKKIINDKSRQRLEGNIALINQDGMVESFNSHDIRYVGVRKQIIQFIHNKGKNAIFYIQYYPQILIYIVAFLVPVIIFYLRRRKKQ